MVSRHPIRQEERRPNLGRRFETYALDAENGKLRYFTIGIENPVVDVDGDLA